jgi:5-methylcytosine-specific restriction enzyme A
MPIGAFRPCLTPGCPELVRGAPRCPKHAQAKERERGSSTSRGYDNDWRRLRDRVLAERPLCVMCEAEGRIEPATVGDHIVPIKVDPSRRLDPSNVRPLCKAHHDQRTDEGDFGRAS